MALARESSALLCMEVDPNRPPGEAASAPLECQTSQPHRILVVDDDPLICELNTHRLVLAGYRVDVAADGVAGWDALQLNYFDLVITDNTMPRMTGIEMIEKVRAAGMVVPVILASGTVPEEQLIENTRLQPIATLPKPYTGVELLGLVKKFLERP
jgi:two-component system alkaline phosphatase synthesis response regulator PhoP